MDILTIVPNGRLFRCFTVLEDGRPVAAVRFAWLSRESELVVGDMVYKACQEHSGYGFFVLKDQDRVVARAQSLRTLFQDSCTIEYAGKRYQLERASIFGAKYVLREEGQVVGHIEPERVLTKRTRACLPEGLPLVVRLFIVALAMDLWVNRIEAD
jgi:hypothetical protein